VALFFTFLFPLLFLFVFGSIFRGDDSPTFNVGLINQSETEFAEEFVKQASGDDSVLHVDTEVTSIDQGKELMGRGQVDSIIVLPEDFGAPNADELPSGDVVVYYEEANPQTGQTLSAVMQGILDGINQELTGHIDPFKVEQRSTSTANLTQFDYTFSGLIGFSLLSLGIFGLADGLPSDKKAGMLRRIRATPLTAMQLVLGTMLNYLLVGILSIALMMLVGILLFGFDMRGDYLSFSIFVLLGMVMLLGFGLAIGGWAKNENQSAPLTNLIAFPMMFLSGTFFPRFLMPDWLQNLTGYLPLTPVIDGIRYITTEGRTIFELGPELALIGVWTVVIYAIAIKVFRWE
jgi:ABC-2 type transport system permease protein